MAEEQAPLPPRQSAVLPVDDGGPDDPPAALPEDAVFNTEGRAQEPPRAEEAGPASVQHGELEDGPSPAARNSAEGRRSTSRRSGDAAGRQGLKDSLALSEAEHGGDDASGLTAGEQQHPHVPHSVHWTDEAAGNRLVAIKVDEPHASFSDEDVEARAGAETSPRHRLLQRTRL